MLIKKNIVGLILLIVFCGQDIFAQNDVGTASAEVKEIVKQEETAPVIENKIDPRLEAVSKTESLFFSLELNLLRDTKKEDLGVTDLKNITEAVTNAWISWGKKELPEFKNFENYNNSEVDYKSALHHPKNVLVLFKANIRRLVRVGVQEKIDLEVGAEYVVVQLSNKKILGSFDYPYIHRSFDSKDQKALSSGVASLFYNLLNAKQGEVKAQINSVLLIPGESKEFEYSIKGAKNLIEINRLSIQLKDLEAKNKNLCTFSNKISSFSLTEAKIILSSTCSDLNLSEVLRTLGRVELNQGRGFQFLPDQKTFEIFDVPSDNNPKKESATP